MDPQATLRDLLDSLHCREWDRVTELSEALLSWMENGGFPPATIGPEELGKQWHRAVATFLCHTANSMAEDARKRRHPKGGGDAS